MLTFSRSPWPPLVISILPSLLLTLTSLSLSYSKQCSFQTSILLLLICLPTVTFLASRPVPSNSPGMGPYWLLLCQAPLVLRLLSLVIAGHRDKAKVKQLDQSGMEVSGLKGEAQVWPEEKTLFPPSLPPPPPPTQLPPPPPSPNVQRTTGHANKVLTSDTNVLVKIDH